MTNPRRQRPLGPPAEERRIKPDRRRASWNEFRHAYPGVLTSLTVALLTLLLASGWLVHKRSLYAAETARLRASMSDVERERTDVILASNERRLQVMVELLRRQARADRQLNLAVSVDDGRLYLQRDGAVLRDVAVRVGGGRTVGTPPDTVRLAAPRGQRTVERVLAPDEPFELPAWVYEERGLPVPEDRSLQGALGAHSVVLNGGILLYSLPPQGPLADSSYVFPGSVLVPAADLEAMAPNIRPGMTIYFY